VAGRVALEDALAFLAGRIQRGVFERAQSFSPRA
jgi:hypothetical protein